MDISKHLEKAEEALRRKNFDGAMGLFEQLLELSPNDCRARKGLLAAAWKRFEYKKPMRALLLASASPNLAAGKSMATMKKWAQAATSYQKACLIDPTNESWAMTLAESLELGGLADGALAVYQHVGEVNPQNLEAWKRAGALLYQKKDLDGALAHYEKALSINPRDQDALKARKNLAAEGILQQKGFETAASSREIMKDKEGQRRLEQDSRLHKTEEEKSESIERLQKEMESGAPDPRRLEKIGRLQESKGDWEAAISSYEKAIQLDPASFDLKLLLDAAELKRLDHKIEQAREAAPNDPTAAEKLKRLEANRLNLELQQASQRASEHPTDLGLRFKLGKLFVRAGRTDEAIGELQKAVADPRWKLECNVLLGQCFFKKNLFDLARKQLEKALEQTSSGSAKAKEILYNLGLIAERMGANADAAGFYSRIYEVDIGYRDVAAKVEQLRGAGN